MQREITEPIDLLDKNGRVLKPGWARRMLYNYNRDDIRANPFALKEWDFYQILHGDWVLQLTIGHVSYTASLSAWAFNLRTGQKAGFSHLVPFPMRRLPMPRNPEVDNSLEVSHGGVTIRYDVTALCRRLVVKARVKGEDFDIDILLNNHRENEKMVIATPFPKPNQFYLNYKENFWGGSGAAKLGEVILELDESTTALIDWGRGVWPFTQEWYWGDCTAYLDGERFGFNIGWGFGDLSHATENMFFYQGKAHKLGVLDVTRDSDYVKPWHFVSDDDSFDLTMMPIYDNYSETKILFIDTHCHQVWGTWNGTVRLPDGRELEIRDAVAFCEHAENRW